MMILDPFLKSIFFFSLSLFIEGDYLREFENLVCKIAIIDENSSIVKWSFFIKIQCDPLGRRQSSEQIF